MAKNIMYKFIQDKPLGFKNHENKEGQQSIEAPLKVFSWENRYLKNRLDKFQS